MVEELAKPKQEAGPAEVNDAEAAKDAACGDAVEKAKSRLDEAQETEIALAKKTQEAAAELAEPEAEAEN